jgi:hypothetical protein
MIRLKVVRRDLSNSSLEPSRVGNSADWDTLDLAPVECSKRLVLISVRDSLRPAPLSLVADVSSVLPLSDFQSGQQFKLRIEGRYSFPDLIVDVKIKENAGNVRKNERSRRPSFAFSEEPPTHHDGGNNDATTETDRWVEETDRATPTHSLL